jgi:hypothetical protein
MSALTEAFDLIDAHPELADFEGPISAELLASAEQALGHQLPADYRSFVERYGAGDFGSQEIYGVFTSDFKPGPPEMVGTTLAARDWGLPPGLLVVADVGDGTQLALDHRDGNAAAPILQVMAGVPPEGWQQAESDFATFLLDAVRRQLER